MDISGLAQCRALVLIFLCGSTPSLSVHMLCDSFWEAGGTAFVPKATVTVRDGPMTHVGPCQSQGSRSPKAVLVRTTPLEGRIGGRVWAKLTCLFCALHEPLSWGTWVLAGPE